jgi:nucleotide-binding universal stress UspA family protein
VAETLANHAQAINADLIIMTTHGWSGFEHFWLGSVAESLLRLTHTPLWLMRPGDSAARAAQPLRRILVPLDGSTHAEQVLLPAQRLAAVDGARLILARALVCHQHSSDTAIIRQKQEIETYLKEIATRLETQGITIDIAVGTADQPARALLNLSRELQADAVALATRGQGGWQRLIMGSVADKIIRASPVPVLVVRP